MRSTNELTVDGVKMTEVGLGITAREGCCEEANLIPTTFYVPCNRPAERMVSFPSGEGPYRMCDICSRHNLRNRNGIDEGPHIP